jgi:hypothetical protein
MEYMNTKSPATKTIAKTAAELAIGDSVKFGKDDFRTIVSFEDKWNTRYVYVGSGKFRMFEINSRKWRVAA